MTPRRPPFATAERWRCTSACCGPIPPTPWSARRARHGRWAFAIGARAGERTGVTVIPTVVHVVWNTTPQNITDAQIHSQIDVLNRDFRKTNATWSTCRRVFRPLSADARIEFVLATTDPAGNPTNGIIRTQTTTDVLQPTTTTSRRAASAAPTPGLPTRTSTSGCARSRGGLLGYAQFPGGPAATDGVVIRTPPSATTGTAAAPFDLGRTATHEIGHWLNLRHIWGDDGNGCNGDDFVADTPNAPGPNIGHADVPARHVQQRPERRHVHELHGLHRRRRRCSCSPTARSTGCRPASMATGRASVTPSPARPWPSSTSSRRSRGWTSSRRSRRSTSSDRTIATFDVKPTLAVLDLEPTLARFDVKPTVAHIDVGPTIAQIDVGPTVAQIDVGPTIAWVDMGGGTLATADLGGPTLGAGDLGPNDPGPMPFLLATPHHTNAWIASHAAMRDQQVESLAAEAQQLEEALERVAQADAEGRLSSTEAASADQLYAEYQRIMAELDDLGCLRHMTVLVLAAGRRRARRRGQRPDRPARGRLRGRRPRPVPGAGVADDAIRLLPRVQLVIDHHRRSNDRPGRGRGGVVAPAAPPGGRRRDGAAQSPGVRRQRDPRGPRWTVALLAADWVNEPAADDRAHRKGLQLQVAQQLGLDIPRTVMTNDPAAALRFIDAHGYRDVVYKSFSSTPDAWRETRVLRSDELGLLHLVRHAPVIFQEYVPAVYDLRVTVVDAELFPAAIYSQETEYPVDCRIDVANTRIEPTSLPDDLGRRCSR